MSMRIGYGCGSYKFRKKIKFLVWLFLHDAVPNAKFRFKRNLATSNLCQRCQFVPKTVLHCFRDHRKA
ncbi:hypothetical protein AHAS_Ahas11G0169600 [Arachis hypogaea]